MKHTFQDAVDINLKIDIPAEDLEDLIDKAVEGAVTIIVAATAARILRSWLTNV